MIRRATAVDFNFVYQLYMHPQVNPFLLYEPMDAESFRPIYDELLQRGVKYIYASNGVSTGMFKWVPETYRSSHIAYLGGLAIHPSHAGKGHGLKMMEEIIQFGKQQGFLRIELSTAVTNEKAIHLYEKAGFEKEGILKKYTRMEKENVFLDEVMMAYLYK
ncbi:MAG: GNAT family N-acetyltransferase [Chitinophagaceae bacterium]|nr:GNAT family N-acetyltransferase [Chitinophagaceae bacterium]